MFTASVCVFTHKGRHSLIAFSERFYSLSLIKRPEKTTLVIPSNVRSILPSALQDMEDDFRCAQILSSTGTLWRALSCSKGGACSSPLRGSPPTHQGALPLTITEEHYSLPLIIFICYLSLCNLFRVEIAPGHIPGRKSDDRKLVNSLPIITLPTPGSCCAPLASS